MNSYLLILLQWQVETRNTRMALHKYQSSGMKTDFPSGPLFTVQNANAQSKTNFRWVVTEDREDRRYLQFIVEGWQYSFIKLKWDLPGEIFDVDFKTLTFNTHLFGCG